jgi:hypothetical protein
MPTVEVPPLIPTTIFVQQQAAPIRKKQIGLFGGCLLVFCVLIVLGAIVGGIMSAVYHTPPLPTSAPSPSTNSNKQPLSVSALPGSSATPSPSPSSMEDVQVFIATYGTPDKEDTTAYDNPRPPMVSRILEYEPEHVRVLCIPDAKVDDSPPYKGWLLVGFIDTRDRHVLKRPEVDERLRGRKKQ